MSFRLRAVTLLALAIPLLATPAAVAQYDDSRYGNDDEEDDGIRQSVARLSWFEGEVSFNRGDDPDDWQFAAVNYPMTLGDRVWVGRDARAELQLLGATAWLAPESELSVLDLTHDVRHLSLTWGTATFRVRRLDRGEVFEVATPNVSVTFETPGVYRIDVDDEGNSRISVFQGRAFAAAAGGGVLLERGERMRIEGLDRPEYGITGLGRSDSWDRWVEKRARRSRTVRSASWVHADVYGLEDLDVYGSWQEASGYGFVWFPTVSSAGWMPYRAGRWIWRDPWGWTWLSYEPWGWAPYHHGRWVVVRGRWAWVPVGPRGRRPGYFPAVVGFVGGGPGWSVTVSAGGFIGWFPLGPREPFYPWWHRSRRYEDRPHWAYSHRNRAVVLPRDAFVRGRWGDRDIVRDPGVLRDLSAAPVLRGPVPVLPSRDSIRTPRATDGGRDATAPPRQAAGRPVVTRRTVPSAPPTFDRKLDVIREQGGAPVPVDESRRLSGSEPRGERPVAPVRSVTREGVALSPRADVAPSRRPQPLPTAEPRPAATVDRPTPRPVEDAVPVRPPTPRPMREIAPTPQPRPRTEPAPLPTPRAGRAPAPQFDPPPTPPQRSVAPAPPQRDVTVPTPRPEAAPTRAQQKSVEPGATPTKAPSRRVSPGPA